ncbi:MAG: hypothetical protein JWR01_1821 [Subtercola sp.]|nr:hypothetical protein [Subtercola sp.]
MSHNTPSRTSTPRTSAASATPPAAATTHSTEATTPAGLRSLHLIRAAFSIVWVALVVSTSGSLVGPDRLTPIATVLLVAYPLWDVVATLIERRMTGGITTNLVSILNVALGLAATAAMIVAAFTTLGSALLVFGIWALLSGAVQLTVAIRRRHSIGAQWPMLISGGLSVLAGAAVAGMSASATAGLTTVAGYSAFGAFWFIVSAVALTLRSRRTSH